MHFSSLTLVEISPGSILNIEALSFSKSLVPIYQTTRRHIPQFSELPAKTFFFILVLGKGKFTEAERSAVSVISCFVYCISHVLFPAISPVRSASHISKAWPHFSAERGPCFQWYNNGGFSRCQTVRSWSRHFSASSDECQSAQSCQGQRSRVWRPQFDSWWDQAICLSAKIPDRLGRTLACYSNERTYYVEIKCQLDGTDVFYRRSYCMLNMHHYAHHQELENIIQLVAVSGLRAAARKPDTQSSAPHHTDNLKTKAPNTTGSNQLYNILELLMMGIMVPETCWASNKICNKNICCIVF